MTPSEETQQRGRKPEFSGPAKNNTGTLNLRLPPDLAADIKERAAADHRSVSDWVRLACVEMMKRQDGISGETAAGAAYDRLKEEFEKIATGIYQEEFSRKVFKFNMTVNAHEQFDEAANTNPEPMIRFNDEFLSLETEAERLSWARNNMVPVDVRNASGNLPPSLRIYGVYEGFVVCNLDGLIHLATFEEIFGGEYYDEEDDVSYNPMDVGIPVHFTKDISPFLAGLEELETEEERDVWAGEHLDALDFELSPEFEDSPYRFYGMIDGLVVFGIEGWVFYSTPYRFMADDDEED